MNRKPATNRSITCCLLLSAVLILGIVQWSFLPILVQSASLPGKALLEITSGHTSKFAAPFKCLFGDSLKPCLPPSGNSKPRIASNFLGRNEEPVPSWQDLFFSYLHLRAPPSA
jgi:hypothetical protein